MDLLCPTRLIPNSSDEHHGHRCSARGQDRAPCSNICKAEDLDSWLLRCYQSKVLRTGSSCLPEAAFRPRLRLHGHCRGDRSCRNIGLR